MASLRSLPRVFLPGLDVAKDSYELPKSEVNKFKKVLRLADGDEIAVLPDDGTVIRCVLRGNQALPIGVERISTEPVLRVTIAQALPKGDRLETVLRMGTELGVAAFVVFQADRSVVRWEPAKVAEKLRRYGAIIRESAEQSFRTRLPSLEFVADFGAVLSKCPDALVLSELESESTPLRGPRSGESATLVVGPEGGWSPREVGLIGSQGVSLGPLVMRTDTAGVAAAAALLLARPSVAG